MENEKDRKTEESPDVIVNTEGGDPGITRETVEEARRANPEQAPDRPSKPPPHEQGTQDSPDEPQDKEDAMED